MEGQLLKRIKELRLDRRLTAAEVSLKMGFASQNGYTKLELGQTDLKHSHIVKLAEIFGVSVASLLGLEDEAGADQGRVKELEERVKELDGLKQSKMNLLNSLMDLTGFKKRFSQKFMSRIEKSIDAIVSQKVKSSKGITTQDFQKALSEIGQTFYATFLEQVKQEAVMMGLIRMGAINPNDIVVLLIMHLSTTEIQGPPLMIETFIEIVRAISKESENLYYPV